MQIHLINLDRSPERLAEFRRRNAHLSDVVRFPAIEGKLLDRAQLTREGVITENLTYTPGAVGSAMSHITLWRRAIETGKPLTVAEDDSIFSHAFEARSEAMLAGLPAGWDLVLWGWNFDAFLWLDLLPGVSGAKLEFDQGRLRENLDTFQALDTTPTFMKLLHCFGIMCYTITPKGAREMLQICLPLSQDLISFPGFGVVIANNTLDCVMNRAYPSLQAFVCMPPLVVSENRQETSTNIAS